MRAATDTDLGSWLDAVCQFTSPRGPNLEANQVRSERRHIGYSPMERSVSNTIVSANTFGCWSFTVSLESLILAQDERWRRA
jgi:hypothetical protein